MTALLSIDTDGCLMCPKCGKTNGLHMDEVIMAGVNGRGLVMVKPAEDAISPVIGVMGTSVAAKFKSARRHTVQLDIWCELCGGVIRVGFIQHKGQTLVRTEGLD